MAQKKRAMPYHVMPDGTMMPGATHAAYLQKEAAAKAKGAKKRVKMPPTNPLSMAQEPMGDFVLGKKAGKKPPVKKAAGKKKPPFKGKK